MKIEQKQWTKEGGWETISSQLDDTTPQLVLVFGGRSLLENAEYFNTLKESYPDSNILMNSSAGEIADTRVRDGSLSVVAIHFEKTTLEFQSCDIEAPGESEACGATLATNIAKENLLHTMVFSDGLKVNGTSLVKGLTDHLPPNVTVTGGLVGDGANFEKTVIGLNQVPESGKIVLVGFYGQDLKIGYGSVGGWDSFGPERLITKSDSHILYELDGKPALELYKKYLGEQAKDLPSSGLLFPLNLYIDGDNGEKVEVVRTVLSVNEEDQSMTFAGDLPEGKYVSLMKANFERLVTGASGAADMSKESLAELKPELAILISCIGRKLVLKERIEEETEAVKETLGGDGVVIAGFYSYGEISPVAAKEKQCQLHNQTMTITTFKEG